MAIDNYLWTRARFPVVLDKYKTDKGREHYDFRWIEIPPWHPSMGETGIPVDLVPKVLDNVIEETKRDLLEVLPKMPHLQFTLDQAEKVRASERHIQREGSGMLVLGVPYIGSLKSVWVDQRDINPYGPSGDQGIRIQPDQAAQSFLLPKEVTLPPELMKEYDITPAGDLFHARRFECKHNWYRHNLDTRSAIFYRNLVMALDNEVVKRKYQRSAEKPSP